MLNPKNWLFGSIFISSFPFGWSSGRWSSNYRGLKNHLLTGMILQEQTEVHIASLPQQVPSPAAPGRSNVQQRGAVPSSYQCHQSSHRCWKWPWKKYHHGSPKVSGTKNPGIRYFGGWVFPHISLTWWYGPFRIGYIVLYSGLINGSDPNHYGMILQVGMPTKVRLKNPGRFTRVPKSDLTAFAVIPLQKSTIWDVSSAVFIGYHVLRRIYISILKKKKQMKWWFMMVHKNLDENNWWSNTDAQNDWSTTTYFTNSSSGKRSKSKFQLAQAIPLPLLYTPSLFKLLPSSMWLWSAKRT